ncbi:MAG: hypothetical protein V4606_00335 [Patescibacteria group bacterium]
MLQTRQLTAVVPKSNIDGFSVSLKRHNTSLIADSHNEDLAIDYYFEVTVMCDGTNRRYPKASYFTVLVSQLFDRCDLEFVSNCPVLMLKCNEQLTSIEVTHAEMDNRRGVWLVFSIKNCTTEEGELRGYLFRPD